LGRLPALAFVVGSVILHPISIRAIFSPEIAASSLLAAALIAEWKYQVAQSAPAASRSPV